ncbi:MAG TPA: sugar ABC transporter permease [Anaerolineales bacterium]|nr:sugar ABC transporter permease [Anaerolineales bacterium]
MRIRHLEWDRLIAILLISPSIFAIAIFVYAFIGWTGWASVLKWNDMMPLQPLGSFENIKILPPKAPFAGLDNYIRLLTVDQRFRIDLWNTLVFTSLFIAACLIVGLLLAVLLDQKIRGEGVFRGIFLFPMSVSFIVTGVVWKWVLTPGT